jgi:PAS domain S-box-containing protein
MPLFTSANGQNANDDIDLQEIFAEYFNEDYSYVPESLLYEQQEVQRSHPISNELAKQQLAANAAAAVAASSQQSGQQLSLPTGHGIKTAFHAGSLPSMHQQQHLQQQHHPVKATTVNQQQVQPPPAKKLKGEEMHLPISQSSLTQKQQLGIGTGNIQYNATMAALSQQQQQLALAHAAAGVGGLSSRLGWNVNVPMATNGTAGLGGSIGGVVVGGSSSTMAPQQQQPPQSQQIQPQQIQQQQMVLPIGGLHFPVGMGLKFGVGGITTTGVSSGSLPVVANREITNNNVLTMANNHAAALALAQGGFQVVGSKVNAIHVTNGNHHQQQQQGIKMMQDSRNMSGEDRRLRNREHAKRSRVRKKFMVESLQQQVRSLQDENSTLRMLVQQHIPEAALSIIDKCCSKSVLFANRGDEIGDAGDGNNNNISHPPSQDQTPLLRSDFSLIESLTSGQQNFVLSDPRLPDNPIVYATPGFYELTGYSREQVLGRNCRFLQGAGTDRRAIDVIRTAVANGTDATVCIMNYKADGTPFWNQLFVAALRDADDCIVNYVSFDALFDTLLYRVPELTYFFVL